MPVNDELGKRMKEYYENIPKTKLMRKGNSTKWFNK